MIHNKAYTKQLKTRNSNTKRYYVILDLVIARMTKQGKGCFLNDHGNLYYNSLDKTSDPIGILTSYKPSMLMRFIGAISDEELKPMVAHLARKFDINTNTGNEYVRFVSFLQNIQDCHDNFTVGISETKFTIKEFVSDIETVRSML